MPRTKGSKDKVPRRRRGYRKINAEQGFLEKSQNEFIQATEEIIKRNRRVSKQIDELRKLVVGFIQELPNELTYGQKRFLNRPEMKAIVYKTRKVLIELDIDDPFSMFAFWKELHDQYSNNLQLQQGVKDITEGKGDSTYWKALTPKLDDFLKRQLIKPNQYKEIDRKNGMIYCKKMTLKDKADDLNRRGGVKKGNEIIYPITPAMLKNWTRKDRSEGGKNRLKKIK